MTFAELIEYQEWYRSLERKDQSAYISSLGSSVYPEREKQLRSLAKEYLHKEITGCGFCIQSAHFEIMNLDIDKMEKITNEYQLLPGAILHDPINKDFNKILTARNITEELALYHIANNKGAIKYFAKYPDDLADRLKLYLQKQGREMADESRELAEKKLVILGRQLEFAKSELNQSESAYNRAREKYETLEAAFDSLRFMLDRRPANDVDEGPEQSGESSTSGPSGEENVAAEGSTSSLDADELERSVKELIASGMDWDAIKSAYADELNDGRLDEEVLKGVFAGFVQVEEADDTDSQEMPAAEEPSKKTSRKKGGSEK